jgi:hypothetical protein
MQMRHRIPTIFNLSMVDMLCCALGCVILLWLLNLREAKVRAITVGQTTDRLKSTESQLDETSSLLLNTLGERDEASRRAEALAKERDQVSRDLEAARARHAALEKEFTALKDQDEATRERLAKLVQDQRALTRERDAAERQITVLESQVQDKESLAKTATGRVEELAAQLRTAEARARKLKADMQEYRSKLSDAEMRAQALENEAGDRRKDLADAGRSIDLLQREKRLLTDQFNRARATFENRFEGIALTGRRVIFLVDMSGSMELVDERTPDANKWTGVRETLGKIMRSLTELDKFQIIVFSDKFSYLLGNDGRWLDYDVKTSVDQALRALAAIKPVGATNMHDAFQAAFRFRADGLDTIYVLSDGLPNTGPGISARQTRELKEVEQSEILAKYIRNLLRSDWNRALRGQARVRINTVGFFYESPDVGAFLWALARENDGSFVGMSKP